MNLHHSRLFAAGSVFASALLLAACAVGPDYQRPETTLPQQWQEANGTAWKTAIPQDAQPKGEWWKIFHDPTLDQLEQQALSGSFTLKAAFARLEQSRALLGISTAARSPSVDLNEHNTRTRTSSNRPASGSSAVTSTLQNDHTAALGVNYEVDLFGRVARDVESATASFEQNQADLENTKLILSTDVAAAYFNLRTLEADSDLLQRTVTLQERTYELMKSRYALGVISGLDIAQQELLLGSTRSQWQLSLRLQALQRHALATLLGVDIAKLNLNKGYLPAVLPDIPLALPAELLQRRPDIASAERAVAAANAQIGVAKSAWFPALRISATDGVESALWGTLFNAPSNTWSLGLAFSQMIYDGGRTSNRISQAEAGHELATANYRQAVLKALQEVEDAFISRRTLAAATDDSRRAANGAEKAATITATRYRLGAATSLESLVTEQNALNAKRQVLALEGQQWGNAVLLIKAFGGSWGE